jgi:serine/threonine protein kinase
MNALEKLPPIVSGRYKPIALIAQGGMGTVYEVEHVRTGERLALKVLAWGVGAPREVLERFKREARASAQIKSQHVVRVIDADVAVELGGAPFLVMELLEGTDLDRATKADRPERATVVAWLRQIAIAIDKAHQLGIIHRDLKPENLFLARQDGGPSIVKVLDFGIVKMENDDGGVTASGEIVGTPAYMAPEQATAGGRVTHAVDLYALGLLTYRLFTGEDYYDGSDVMKVVTQLLYDPLQPPSQRHPELGAAFDAWFTRACERDPKRRFGSASEQVEALAAALGLAAEG